MFKLYNNLDFVEARVVRHKTSYQRIGKYHYGIEVSYRMSSSQYKVYRGLSYQVLDHKHSRPRIVV